MTNGIWTKETFLMGVPEEDQKIMSMTHDLLKDLKWQLNSIDDKVDKIHNEQPAICAAIMDDKIKLERKLRRKINFGIGSGGGIGVVAIFEFIRSIWPK